MGKKSAPATPDYQGLAEQQAGQQQDLLTQQTWANRADQSNPWGKQSWQATQVTDPTTGKPVTKWSQNTTLDPQLQSALDAQMGAQAGMSQLGQSRVGQLDPNGVDTSGFTNWGSGPQAGNLQAVTNPYSFGGVPSADAARARAEDAIYKSSTSRLDPQWQQRQGDMEAQLANQGITRNSAAYTRAMSDFNTGRNDAYQQAQMGAVTGGGQEAQRNFGMDLQGQQYNLYGQQQAFNQAQQAGSQNFSQGLQGAQYMDAQRGQQLAEQMGIRQQDFAEIQALLGGGQVNMPNFGDYTSAGQGQAADISGAAQNTYEAGVGKANANKASASAGIAGAATIAAAMI